MHHPISPIPPKSPGEIRSSEVCFVPSTVLFFTLGAGAEVRYAALLAGMQNNWLAGVAVDGAGSFPAASSRKQHRDAQIHVAFT